MTLNRRFNDCILVHYKELSKGWLFVYWACLGVGLLCSLNLSKTESLNGAIFYASVLMTALTLSLVSGYVSIRAELEVATWLKKDFSWSVRIMYVGAIVVAMAHGFLEYRVSSMGPTSDFLLFSIVKGVGAMTSSMGFAGVLLGGAAVLIGDKRKGQDKSASQYLVVSKKLETAWFESKITLTCLDANGVESIFEFGLSYKDAESWSETIGIALSAAPGDSVTVTVFSNFPFLTR